jgi:hypothetical protein
MGEGARATDAASVDIVGIIPGPFPERELLFREADEVIITDSPALTTRIS